jgi:hypothetical protein
MKNFLNSNRYVISGLLIGGLLMYGVAHQIAEKRLALLQTNLESQQAIKATEATNLATLLAQGGTSPAAATIINDCTVGERAQFDNRLGRLDLGLSKTELSELDNLFNRCASVQATRRAIMVLQLEATVTEHAALVEHRKLLGSYEKSDSIKEQLQLLLASEKSISSLSYDQVNLQKEIIQDLLLGLDVGSVAANELREKGSAIRNELISLTETSAVIRENLLRK